MYDFMCLYSDFENSFNIISQRDDCIIKDCKTFAFKDKTKKINIKININEASEEEFTALPGINRILAKKVVKYRTSKRGFQNKKEFYDLVKLKPHFVKQIKNKIIIKRYNNFETIFRNAERVVDV